MQVRFRPIEQWPGDLRRQRTNDRFDTSWPKTLQQLEYELEKLGAKEIVIEIAVTDAEIRIDGWPRSDARPRHPGVIISFDSKYGPLRYMTDAFLDWHGNVRAIALGLEALRKVDRYGITRRGEQYTGWKALPSGVDGNRPMTVEEAGELLAGYLPGTSGPQVVKDASVRLDAYRAAAKETHPDRGGQDTGRWVKVQAAYETLKQFA